MKNKGEFVPLIIIKKYYSATFVLADFFDFVDFLLDELVFFDFFRRFQAMELGISGAAVSIALPDIVLRKVKKKLVFFRPSMLHFIRN